MTESSWEKGLDPTRKMAKLGEMTIRLSRMMLFKKLQQAETQLRSMGIPNDISTEFLKSSGEVLRKNFGKPELRYVRIDTTDNSVF